MRDNLALGRPATQSSVSQWSKGPTPEADAAGGNNGLIDGEAGFHTGLEASPWWQVDLQAICFVREVHLFNRRHCASRLRHFSILTSLDGAHWTAVFAKTDEAVFGEQELRPYVAVLPDSCLARFVRVRLDGTESLHFSECQVFGEVADPATIAALQSQLQAWLLEQEQTQQRREALLRDGRRGDIVKIGEHAIFVDLDRYSPMMVGALGNGGYEARERKLVTELLRPGDRVLEIGTAVGVVAMTAAKVVGATNVLTFDANPQIVTDAQRNFAYNGLAAIRSYAGVLRNRTRFSTSPPCVEFSIARDFWASRLFVGPNRADIVATVNVPTACLEDQIASHAATVIICDIEGGEIELLLGADLSGIRLIIIELHDWAVGQQSTDAMIRDLIVSGFNVDLYRSGDGMAVLRR